MGNFNLNFKYRTHNTMGRQKMKGSAKKASKAKMGRKSKPATGGIKKASKAKRDKPRAKPRYKPGTVALRDIRKYQKSGKALVPFAPFVRLAKSITSDVSSKEHTFSRNAIMALMEAATSYLTGLFEDASLCCTHANRTTVYPKDMRLALKSEERQETGRTMPLSSNSIRPVESAHKH